MGFDISYHPISKTEINEWYFNAIDNKQKIADNAKKHKLEDFYANKYEDTLTHASKVKPTDAFETTHSYFIAVVQGFFRDFYYTRGSAFSFLIEEKPAYAGYTTNWEDILEQKIENSIQNEIVNNYSGGVYISEKQVIQLLNDYHSNDIIKQDLDSYYSHGRIKVFLKALEVAKANNLGILEATEVVEPNPIDLNDSTCYSNLFNCDIEGAMLYQEAAREQMSKIEELNNLSEEEFKSKVSYEKTEIQKPNKSKKNFWQRLFGK